MPGVVFPGLLNPEAAALAAVQQQLRHSQWWPAEQIHRYQTRQLALLLRHARDHVPYYRESAAYHASNDWHELPVLTRETLQQNYQALKAAQLPDGYGPSSTASTSGSTGTPVEIEQTAIQRKMIGAFALRANDWHARAVSGRLAVISQSQNDKTAFPGLKQQGWGWPTDTLYHSGPAFFLDLRTPIAQQWEWLQKVQPHYLMTWPTNLETLLQYSAKSEVGLRQLQQITTLGETADEELREQCREQWQVPVFDVYSSREAGSLAVQCPQHDCYHVMSENVRLEVIDDEGRPCAPGDIGRVVITPIHSFAMPLLRYAVGDYAEVGNSCACGRGLPVLKRILGRTRNMFYLPDGKPFWPFFSRSRFSAAAPIRQHQLVQAGPDTIVMNVVVERDLNDVEERRLLEILKDALPTVFNLRLNYVDNIPRGRGGKYEYTRCDWSPKNSENK